MPGRRPLVALVALFVVPLPACLHVGAPVASDAPPDGSPKVAAATPPRILFAELPRVPGTVVPTKPTNPDPPANTAHKPPNPPKPADAVRPATNTEPGPFPVLTPPPTPVEAPLLGAVRAYTENRPEKAIEIIRTMNPPNQDLVLALLPVLARAVSADLNNDPATVGALVEQLHSAAGRLEPRAALRIEKTAFCKDVSGFGRFVPWPDNQPYRPNAQAQLYLEVRNLGSQPAGDGFVTSVQAAVEVRDAHQKLVEQIDPDDWKRRVPVVKFEKRLGSRSPLHDFHVLYLFSVPAAPGVYTVTVELRDATGRRTVKTPPAQFCVAGP